MHLSTNDIIVPIEDNLALIVVSNHVGTKVLVAQWANSYTNIGQDIVNVIVNDTIAVGAIPKVVSINYSCLKDTSITIAEEIGKGCNLAAKESNVTVQIGEISHLPEILSPEFPGKTFNLSGTGVSICGLNRLILGDQISEGDKIIGFESNGLHCNGYALAKKVLLKRFSLPNSQNAGYELGDIFEPTGEPIETELLKPTFSYFTLLVNLFRKNIIPKGLANVTSKGITALLPLSHRCGLGFNVLNFPTPSPIFQEIEKVGSVEATDMYRVFNMGIGFYCIAANDLEDDILDISEKSGIKAYEIGDVKGSGGVHLKLETARSSFN